IRERWAALVGSAFECRNRLATSIVKGNGDTAALYAQALAETTANAEAEQEVRRAVGASVLAALKGHYAPIASVASKRVPAVCDQAAQERDDYQLDQMLIVLCAAARLCGATPDIAPHATAKLGLTLSVAPKQAHLRRLAEAFAQPDRWARVRDLGGDI